MKALIGRYTSKVGYLWCEHLQVFYLWLLGINPQRRMALPVAIVRGAVGLEASLLGEHWEKRQGRVSVVNTYTFF